MVKTYCLFVLQKSVSLFWYLLQWFSILFLGSDHSAHFKVCLFYLIQLIQIFSSLCVSDKRDEQNLQSSVSPGPGLKTIDLQWFESRNKGQTQSVLQSCIHAPSAGEHENCFGIYCCVRFRTCREQRFRFFARFFCNHFMEIQTFLFLVSTVFFINWNRDYLE